jgi:hypothetical protein
MKTIKPFLFLCVALCFATSCKKDVDMTLLQKTALENIDIREIEVSDAWQVTVVADSNSYVVLEYSSYLENNLKAKMEGTKLEIGFAGSIYPAINSVYRAIVHTPQIEKLDADEASKIQFIGEFTGHQLEIELSDASQCNGPVFTGQSCNLKMEDASLLTGLHFVGSSCIAELEHASQFNGQIEAADQLEITLEDASRFVNKGGQTAKANIKAHDASRLNMVETLVNEMYVDLTGGSEATVWVDLILEVKARDASTLYYKGHPQMNVDFSDDSQLIPF